MTVGVDWLVAGANADAPLAERVAWIEQFIAWVRARGGAEAEEAAVKSYIAHCVRALTEVAGHLENYGVSIDLVYQLERAQLSLRRMEAIVLLRGRGLYRAMLASAAIGGDRRRSAAIGGAVTGMTVLVKIATVGHGLPLFIEGLIASVNYALSFVLIHLLHGTLATKQPAMTAATMAHQLNAPRARGRLRRSIFWCHRAIRPFPQHDRPRRWRAEPEVA